MSFIKASDVVFARDLWPSGIGRPICNYDNEATLPLWRIMPYGFDEMCAWAVVDAGSSQVDGMRRIALVYEPSVHMGRSGAMCHVTIRVQGFIQSININPLGNWNGREHDAPRALQAIVLGSGGFKPPFAAQVAAFSNVRAMIVGALGGDVRNECMEEDKLEMKRRVFTRVRPTSAPSLRSGLWVGDDPTGRASRIASRWVVSHRITTGIQLADGRITPALHMAFRRGDFVDVAVFAEVVTRGSRWNTSTEINFAMQDVVRLYAANDLKANVKAAMTEVLDNSGQCETEEGLSGFRYDNAPNAVASSSQVGSGANEVCDEDAIMPDN